MNRYGLLCRCILEHPKVTQRELALMLDVSLGTVNTLIKECTAKAYLALNSEGDYELTSAGMAFMEQFRVEAALIIAAGFGSRFVPLTFETPKGLLEVFGERMIERQIKQLHAANIRDITIVVGYLKEKFEYLIDKYQVKLLYNPEYSCKNTLATVYRAREVLRERNVYLLSSDNWMRENMYHTYECGGWYSSVFMEGDTSEWCLSFNKKGRITESHIGGRDSWVMYGPVFFSKQFSRQFLPVLESYYQIGGTQQFYWEQVYTDLLNGDARRRIINVGLPLPEVLEKKAGEPELDMYINRQPANQVYEFENLEELRLFDPKYQSKSDNQAMELVSRVFQIPESEIRDIRCLKSGMTNQSFLFQVQGTRYLCRIPGPGTEFLINRRQEKNVYDVVAPLGITEHVIYFDGETGYKISEFYEGSRNADPANPQDMKQCMALLRQFHDTGLQVDHSFDLKERIAFYEKLCYKQGTIPFDDYDMVSEWMEELLKLLGKQRRIKVLAHIDSVADNFLFLSDGSVRLIDWEYAGMCDPLIDVAMCAIYSYYTLEQAYDLLQVYLDRDPTRKEQLIFYAYMGLGGFLWALWAVYKANMGQEFGEYTIIMYRYAKNCYRKIFSDIL